MSQIQHLIDNSTDLWQMKDDLYVSQLLDHDPLKLYKGKFVEYMKAKAGALYKEYSVDHDHVVAVHLTNLRMKEIAVAWKAAAARVKGN